MGATYYVKYYTCPCALQIQIRGEISEGMMLSERELELSDDHDGIIEITNDFSNGI